MSKLISTNPARNYEIVGEVAISADEDIKRKVALANAVKKKWKEMGIEKRIQLLTPVGEEFKVRASEIAEIITKEMGKPIKESIREVNGDVGEFDWYLKHIPEALKDEITFQDKKTLHKIVYEPYGAAAVISPWNFPFGVTISVIASNLIAGNVVIFKISEECPLTGKLMEEIINNHGLPPGVFSEVYGAGDVGEKLAKSDIDLICFTGSTRTGQSLYKIAADKFIKAILEMGGSNPCIIFEDADLDKAIPIIYKGRFSNCGQVCVSIKRLLIHESIFDETLKRLENLIKTKRIGDPMNQDTDMGSLAAKRQLLLLQEQVKDAVNKGAKIIKGKEICENLKGAYYPQTILTDISQEMRVWKEEVFGPVLSVIKFKTEEEAIALANDTIYGLGSRVFSKNIERAERVASQIQAGTVEINEGNRWHPFNPFGGYKKSGMGRQQGTLGFRELCQIKVVSIG
ncbi:MAG: aldehyde dehydrogenase family protein [bacterium]